jgi:ubiquinone/menaquinone biosynthesis C-methylase UbiE
MIRRRWTDKEVEQHWDSVAGIYVEENNRVKFTHDQRFTEASRFLQPEKGHIILNISSRDCEADDFIRKVSSDPDITHAEISGEMIRLAQKLRPQVKQVKISTYSSLPFTDASFDRILSLETLEHAAEPDKFLSELYRVAKIGARMVLSCPPATSEVPYQVYTLFFGGHGEGPHRFPSSREVIHQLGKAGWKLLSHRGTMLIPAGPQWLQEKGEQIIDRYQKTFVSELGIRQFYVCEK